MNLLMLEDLKGKKVKLARKIRGNWCLLVVPGF